MPQSSSGHPPPDGLPVVRPCGTHRAIGRSFEDAGEKTFRRWDIDQSRLFPQARRYLVAADHLVHFDRDVVLDELGLSLVYAHYEELRGYPPYHLAMMTALLLYRYCRGVCSSRWIERVCEERVDFMALTGMGLKAGGFTGPYRLRMQVVEPVFGQIKRPAESGSSCPGAFRRSRPRGRFCARPKTSGSCSPRRFLL
jgi:hypothetical protein